VPISVTPSFRPRKRPHSLQHCRIEHRVALEHEPRVSTAGSQSLGGISDDIGFSLFWRLGGAYQNQQHHALAAARIINTHPENANVAQGTLRETPSEPSASSLFDHIGSRNMATSSPPVSPPNQPQRPLSGINGMQRSSSRMSVNSRQGGSSRLSDDDARTAVKVGELNMSGFPLQDEELKHSINLAVRVRPPLKPTDPGFDLIPQRFQRSLCRAISPTSLAIDSPSGREPFVFDRVFAEDVQQEGVWDYISESIEAFLQGYNVSVLAYGQSGSGKSYTMGTSGAAEQSDPQMMGTWCSSLEKLS
ncbi:MAG: hypothetical protein Q9191_004409, partial [Dirinaria sp. TL-2023a]